MSQEAGRSAVEGITQGVSNAPGPIRQALRETLLGDDTLPMVSQRIAEATVEGLRQGLSESETQQLIDQLITNTVASIGRQSSDVSRQLIQTVEPELNRAVRRSMTDISSTLGESLDRDLAPRTRDLARAISEVLVSALSTSLDVQLEHIRKTARDIGREMIAEAALSMREQKEFVGEITQIAMRQGMRGAIEGARESLPGQIPRELMIAMFVLAALAFMSGSGLIIYWWRYRQSSKSLTIIARQINDFEADDLKDAIHKSASNHYVGKWLSNFLTRRGL